MSMPRVPSSAMLRDMLKAGAAAVKAAGKAPGLTPSPPAGPGTSSWSPGGVGRSTEDKPERAPRRIWAPHGALLGVLLVALLAGLGLLAMATSRPGPYKLLAGAMGGRTSRLASLEHIAFPAPRHAAGRGGVAWNHGPGAASGLGPCKDYGQWPLRSLGFPAGGGLGDRASFPVCQWDGAAVAAALVKPGLRSGSGTAPGYKVASGSAPAPGDAALGMGLGAPAAENPNLDLAAAAAAASSPRGAPAVAAARACGTALGVPQVCMPW